MEDKLKDLPLKVKKPLSLEGTSETKKPLHTCHRNFVGADPVDVERNPD